MKNLSLFIFMLFALVAAQAQSVSFSYFNLGGDGCGKFASKYTISGVSAGFTKVVTLTSSCSSTTYYTSSSAATNGTGTYLDLGPACGGQICAGTWTLKVRLFNASGALVGTFMKYYVVTLGQAITCEPCGGGGGSARIAANMENTGNDVVINGPGGPGELPIVSITCNSFFPNTNICGSFWGGFTVSNPYGLSLTRKFTISGPSGVYSTNTVTGVANGYYSSGNWGLACGGYTTPGVWTMTVQLFYANGSLAASCQKTYNMTSSMVCPSCNNGGGNRMGDLEEETSSSSLSIAPNPATDHLNVQIPSGLGMNKLTVLNLNGQVMMEKTLDSDATELELNVNDLPNAMYILKLEGAAQPQMTKFVKQ